MPKSKSCPKCGYTLQLVMPYQHVCPHCGSTFFHDDREDAKEVPWTELVDGLEKGSKEIGIERGEEVVQALKDMFEHNAKELPEIMDAHFDIGDVILSTLSSLPLPEEIGLVTLALTYRSHLDLLAVLDKKEEISREALHALLAESVGDIIIAAVHMGIMYEQFKENVDKLEAGFWEHVNLIVKDLPTQ